MHFCKGFQQFLAVLAKDFSKRLLKTKADSVSCIREYQTSKKAGLPQKKKKKKCCLFLTTSYGYVDVTFNFIPIYSINLPGQPASSQTYTGMFFKSCHICHSSVILYKCSYKSLVVIVIIQPFHS